jgi:hypothetical protein
MDFSPWVRALCLVGLTCFVLACSKEQPTADGHASDGDTQDSVIGDSDGHTQDTSHGSDAGPDATDTFLPAEEVVCDGHNDQTPALVVKPFVQWVTPTSAWIQWETDEGVESRVVWSEGDSLARASCGSSHEGYSWSQIHEVQLSPLKPNTIYHYQVSTGGRVGEIHHFKTAPLKDSEASFRMVVLSDSQHDSSNPDILEELINEGIINFTLANFGADLAEELAMVLVAGDLVDSGWVYPEWELTFFDPASNLLSQVPVYPVTGNHEGDSPFYFSYFHLPENGLPDTLEHQWTLDYSNVRVVGLDSNNIYRTDAQLAWLDDVLTDACADEHIDFVFAELHHPHKSELWIEGEVDYTGQVIKRLETFSTDCGKPSIHFFGHTHGYSRGQSRGHQHLWVNAASAGGNIDYWGEYAQTDYDEFTVTLDEWGFVLMEVEAGDNPQFRLRRISRGNELIPRDNAVRDDLTIRRYNQPPVTPSTLAMDDGAICPSGLMLKANDFTDPDGDAHQGSHFQVSSQCDDFSTPVYEKWIQAQNWYDNVDTMAGVPLTEVTTQGLPGDTPLCWRVRYRDSGLRWSDWSAPSSLKTTAFATTDNLLVNADAEAGTDGWFVAAGHFESLTDGECDGISPHGGKHYFSVGAICLSVDYSEVSQSIALSQEHLGLVEAGKAWVELGGFLTNFEGKDMPQMKIALLDDKGNTLATSATVGTLNNTWTWVATTLALPPETHHLKVTLTGTRASGTDNDSYFDDLSVKLATCGAL